MPWTKMLFGDQRVFVRVDAGGALVADREDRVEMKYRLADAKFYRASKRRLTALPAAEAGGILPDDAAAPAAPAADRNAAGAKSGASGRKSSVPAPPSKPIPKDAYIIYTDGACSGNPGPAGLGVVIMADGKRRELSEYLGMGTNNVAELSAVKRALEETLVEVPDGSRPVVLYLDSEYVRGLLVLAWKAKANRELVEEIRALTRRFRDLRFVHVDGHAGVPENERCDQLAREALGHKQR